MNTHTVEYISPQAIKTRVRPWRKHAPAQMAEAKRQLEHGRVVEPPLIDSENRVVCGSLIVLTAQRLNMESIPVLRVNNMSPEELRLYAINASKLADMGEYDDVVLAEELRELEKLLDAETFKMLAIAEGALSEQMHRLVRCGRAGRFDVTSAQA